MAKDYKSINLFQKTDCREQIGRNSVKHTMKAMIKAVIVLILAGLWAEPSFASDTNAVSPPRAYLPMELQNFLKNAETFTLFSIEPNPDFEHKSTNTFQGHAILGRLNFQTASNRAKLIAALDDGIGEEEKSIPPGVGVPLPDCFNPRHGIRATKGDETIEFLICFECAQIQVSSNKGKSWFFMTAKKPAGVFNSVLRRVHVPLPSD
jgi:hypothetical protein